MKLNLLFIASFLLTLVSASRYVLVFETGKITPKDHIDEVKQAIETLGGKITFNYELTITGFSFTLPKTASEKLNAVSKKFSSVEFPFFIEEDSTVNAS
ncbi:unnamed protein product [Kuraishia capsulata CBS 1993]|uniref:Inhibitor I9 domain-containing protein n=1 Tax=Kuraishia capsulata CBS 1993 TaxID=1382522 RepID=W6MKV1_9ASCO|nr:uncharacterized protein KUCA_T00003086001 [Kuraishia capsulata CBS 1993]CDK27109.1 unnamed protein product [Kuraishia capsulata CBS 1993]